ncbi:MDR family NADP-dependent oxidoreductase [Sphingomonas sp. YL-JM2C]
MTELPMGSREVRLARTHAGLPAPGDFEIVSVPRPAAAGEVLVRNLCFLVSASLRQMILKGASDEKGVPFPAIRTGEALRGEALGEVIAAPGDSGFSSGDLVVHFLGWRDYAVVPVTQCRKVRDDLPDRAAHLGHGWTAYAALTRGVAVRPGDTVFISSGGGAIGSMAAQVARLLGAARIIGSTSTREKADRLVSELGYDAAVHRDGPPILQQLSEAAPEGLDVFLDNVGGEQFQAGVAACREGGRVVVLGTLSQQLAAEDSGNSMPVPLDSTHILMKRLLIRGYSADDDPDARQEWERHLGDRLRSGQIRFPHVVVEGLAEAPRALERTIRGGYLGTVIVKI